MPIEDHAPEVDQALTRLARQEGGRVLALLARRFNDVDLADESVQDGLAEAAKTWPTRGIPDNPPGWLFAVAKRKAIDRLRRQASATRRMQAAAPDLSAASEAASSFGEVSIADTLIDDAAADPALSDDLLRLILLCCHPALNGETQVALTLRLVGGLTTPEIAAAFLVPEATLAQRIVRAKRKIRDAGMALSIPSNLDARIDAVLGVLYLIFNEGYLSRGTGEATVRVDLIDESVRLTRLLASLAPHSAETHGLLALQLFHRARTMTRIDALGELVLLEAQDRAQWDQYQIAEANNSLNRAIAMMTPGPFQVQAIIAGHHANAASAAETDWASIVVAYRHLTAITHSPVVAINHAVAVAMADGPHVGLALLEEVQGADGYHLLHAARAELSVRADRPEEALEAFGQALALTENRAEQRHLRRRIQDLQ